MFPLFDSIKSSRFPFFNYAIIVATVYVFYLQFFSSADPEAFITTYALIPTSVDFANWDTLLPFITSIFLHGGILHILSNMWFLWVFGDDVEGHLGPVVFLLLYFLSGVLGGFIQYLFMTDSSIPMLGASGAVAGVLGAYWVLFPHSRIKTFVPLGFIWTTVEISAPIMLGYWFLTQIFAGVVSVPFSSEPGGIAFWAHVGGFVCGVVFGKLFQNKGEA